MISNFLKDWVEANQEFIHSLFFFECIVIPGISFTVPLMNIVKIQQLPMPFKDIIILSYIQVALPEIMEKMVLFQSVANSQCFSSVMRA